VTKTRILLLVVALAAIATMMLVNTTSAQPAQQAVRFVLQLELKQASPTPAR
jgi:hypothetical protein